MVFQQLSEYIIPLYSDKSVARWNPLDIAQSSATISLGFIIIEDIDPKSNRLQCRQMGLQNHCVMEFTKRLR
ncbi:hypothetical protein BAG01nite_48420 [Brevibacillus agri]|uniref:Uncharacterized protein n=2 Tax=Brevibacillus agri TaxID=51101 RepID=A0A3M8ANB2_9BACL|nr:hypothetical protein BA6348_25265 [Brevibacillus agri]RNB51985.1 hypothetical protein EB820_19475 [Brevibacillus agri]GED28740.1 hypothetical protein BAG01nite_48420 [Brevibacillus agri]